MSQLPLFTPTSEWSAPKELPDLSGIPLIAVDTETRDEGLSKGLGPGWAMGLGHVAGVSLAWEDKAVYLPWRHADSHNFELRDYMKALFRQDHTRFVFHNATYDLGFLNCGVPKQLGDTAAMAAIIDENRFSYSLDNLAKDYCGIGKDETLLTEAAAAFGFNSVKENMWRLPAKYVGPYAEQDARATLRLYNVLMGKIKEEGTEKAYQLEADLIPVILEMRRRGVRVDLELTERQAVGVIAQRDEVLKEISDKLAHTTDIEAIRSPQWLKRVFDAEGIKYPRTEKGNASFLANWMKASEHWLPKLITRAKMLDDMANKFLRNYILDFAHKGRLHASINQFRSEGGGTRSHRFSYSNPPLQQAPSKDPVFGPMFRGLFLPEVNEIWAAIDFSQQELRGIVHYAEVMNLSKAKEAGDKYREDPNTDFHTLVADLTGLPRKRAKDVSFAKAYGAGIKQFASMTGMSEDEAREAMDQYDRMMPFVKDLNRLCQDRAAKTGTIRLIDGALCHFPLWESAIWDAKGLPTDRETAIAKVQDPSDPWYKHSLRRAYTQKSMNRLIQGSSARQTKIAMRNCWLAGYVPLLQVHDELDFSFSKEEDALRVKEIMENAVELTIPNKCDVEYGLSWGDSMKGRSWEEVKNEVNS